MMPWPVPGASGEPWAGSPRASRARLHDGLESPLGSPVMAAAAVRRTVASELVYEVDGQRQTYALTKDEITIGRSPENDLVIQDSSISRQHARVFRSGNAWRVADMGSKNGTHLNDHDNTNVDLQDGDEIILGKFPLTFSDESSNRRVSLTQVVSPEMSDSAGTVFRLAVDFSALAASGPAAGTTAAPMDAERLGKLLAILTKASKSLLTSKPLQDTLQNVLEIVFEHLPVDRGVIMLWDADRQALVEKVSRQRQAGTGAYEIKFSRTIADKVFRDKVSVLTTDAQSDPRFAGGASILALGIRSAMAAPLWHGEHVEGLIYVDTPLHVKAFADFDLDVLSALGNLAAIAIEQTRLQESILSERLSRQRLERYHSPAVIERIARGGASGELLAADEREVTVLFADVVGFTSRCEGMEPRMVAEMLNRCFSRMADMIFRHEGTLDKFIGDCLMAVFGAPFEQPDHAVRAVQAALDMRQALHELNEELDASERLEFTVGMHSGRVIAGDIGSVRRSDYTVLGATVNLAARIQSSVAKAGQVVISDVTHERVSDLFETRYVGESQPKGISRMVKCYEVLRRK
jgi:adenylate cyclase